MLIFSRINPTGIVLGHFRTFYDATNGRASVLEIIVFAFVLLGLGGVIYWLNPIIQPEFFSSLLNFYAIIGGFLISALFIIISYGEVIVQNRRNLPDAEIARYRTLHGEIFSNTSFGVLVAFFGSGICVLLSLLECQRILISLSAVCIFVFLHTLLMVLKRLDRLFRGSL